MDNRKEKILKFVIENYIKNVDPVGSKFLVSNFDLEIGEATARNEMRFLEDDGYLAHPHTSSGRIPTEKGYKYYIDNILKTKKISQNNSEQIYKIFAEKIDDKIKMKNLAKFLAEKTSLAVIVSIDKDSIFYTGLSNLFSQPEFKDYNLTVNVSTIFDHCENKITELNEKLQTKKIDFFIGEENPLDKMCSLITLKLKNHSIITLLGPIRMDYQNNINYINFLKEFFK
jgi:heat-inducible transcriptional repressor